MQVSSLRASMNGLHTAEQRRATRAWEHEGQIERPGQFRVEGVEMFARGESRNLSNDSRGTALFVPLNITTI